MNSVLQCINHIFDEGSINAVAAAIDCPSHGNGSTLGYYLIHLCHNTFYLYDLPK